MTIILTAALLAAASSAGGGADCAPLPGVERILGRPEIAYLLIGEYHGTIEMPAVAADALCAAASADRPAVLGIEFPLDSQPYIDAYMRSDGGAAARAALLEAPAWKEEGGRSTAAILDLIERARALAAAGRKVTVAAFDKVPSPIVSKEREEGLAQGLAEAQARVPGSIVVALTGAAHADRQGWVSRTPPFAAAAGLLPQERTVTITFARPGGQYWGCSAPDGNREAGCTAYDMPVREPVASRGIVLDKTLRAGFDGIYHSGKAYSASRPALSGQK